MAHTVDMIGLQPAELAWVRLLVALLRHPDPAVAQLAQHAILYARQLASRRGAPDAAPPAPYTEAV